MPSANKAANSPTDADAIDKLAGIDRLARLSWRSRTQASNVRCYSVPQDFITPRVTSCTSAVGRTDGRIRAIDAHFLTDSSCSSALI
jgi:hypothetical protein